MTERKYSVKELDELRRCCEMHFLYGTYGWPSRGGMSRSYMENDKVKAVEEAVRTHMIAGHTADDLLASERPDAKPNVATIQAVATDTTRLDWLLRNTRVCQDWKWTGNNHPKYGNLNDLDTREDIDRAIMEEMVRG